MDQSLNILVRQAAESTIRKVLEELARHPSKFVRARVAGNKNISKQLHDTLLLDPEVGVVYWAIGNPRLTRSQFAIVFERLLQPEYIPILHPALAGHRFVTIPQMQKLLKFREWSIDLAVVNNGKGRDQKQFLKLIALLLPPESKHSRDWNEVERRAYFHTYGFWWKTDEDEDKGAAL